MGLTRASTGAGAAERELELRRSSPRDRIVALAGNPNVGKSTLFNTATRMRQHTGNWPGKTVTTASGRCRRGGRDLIFVDLPGTYSLTARSAEEEVAREFIASGEADAVAVLCDASCLERSLVLVLQTLKLTRRVVAVVNLLDEAEQKGIRVNTELLSDRLGIPVVGTSASRGRGVEQFLRVVEELADRPRQDPEPSEDAEPPKAGPVPDEEDRETARLVGRAEQLCTEAVRYETDRPDARDRQLDEIFTSRLTGIPVMLLLLTGILWLTIVGANYPSELLSTLFQAGEGRLAALLLSLGAPVWLQACLTAGVWRVTGWVVSVMLPPMAIFFPLFTLLEDFGYLPRVAYVLDYAFQKAHACGKQALTMCLGL